MLIEVQWGGAVLSTLEVSNNATESEIYDAVVEEVMNDIDYHKVDEDGYPIKD